MAAGTIVVRAVGWSEIPGGGPGVSNVVGIICPLVGTGLTELPNSGWAIGHPAHPLTASLVGPQDLATA